MPRTIEPAPETWFTSVSRRAPPPDDIRRYSAGISGETVDAIADALDLGESHDTIADAACVSLHLVGLIRVIRHQWDDKRKTIPPPKTLIVSNGRRPVAPDGSRVVPPYQCDGGDGTPHWTVFSPCLICRTREFRENRRLLAKLG